MTGPPPSRRERLLRPIRAFPWARLVGGIGLVAASATIYWLTTDPAFAIDPAAIPVRGGSWTDERAVRDAMELPDGVAINVFRLPTVALEERIEGLASVRSARVRAVLPDLVEISIVERDPVLVWQSASGTWLVDGAGRLFEFRPEAGEGEGLPAPLVSDLRTDSPAATGATLPADDLEVGRRLAAVTPALLGSAAPSLGLEVRDEVGWVVVAPDGWEAIFGIYTATVRPPSMIGAQVQCLGALLAARETTVRRVLLAPGPENCGTFIAGGERRFRPAPDASGAP